MIRRVRGILFVDYVRMLRGSKGVDWAKYLLPEDIALMQSRIDPAGWYSMDAFERYGVAILAEVAHGQLEAVRMWGRFQLDAVRVAYPTLVAQDEPRETMMRFQTLRRTFFDYDALNVVAVDDGSATIAVAYGMGRVAEEAASHQTLGFFERLAEVAGGKDVYARFRDKSWEGRHTEPTRPPTRPPTRIDLDWH